MKDYKDQVPEISTPICDFVQEYAASGISRFHMPGHKGMPVFPGLSMQTDITEIRGADCLYTADSIIRESERNATVLFGTGATLYSTEGSSQCIRAMLALAAGKGPAVILAARNVHRSFLTAAALLDLDVQWLYPEPGSTDSICSCPVTAKQVHEALSSMVPLPAAVYLTSPDYLGMLQDIKGIAEAAHDYGVPLLVDNAHGAYLHFLKQPVHPMDLGADMCCDSAHKTLPALTGCAYLHISKKAAPFYAARARKALSLFGSTSPSWLLLASLDYTNKILGEDFRDRLEDCVSQVQALKSLCISMLSTTSEEPLKITIRADTLSLTGTQIADLLRQHKIECEYEDPDYVVMMISPCNTQEDLMRLGFALQTIMTDNSRLHPFSSSIPTTMPAHASFTETSPSSASFPAAEIPESVPDTKPGHGSLSIGKVQRSAAYPVKAMTIREAALAPSKRIPIDQAAGQICADLTLSCPPGIPVTVCGEIITDESIAMLKHYKIPEIEVLSGS